VRSRFSSFCLAAGFQVVITDVLLQPCPMHQQKQYNQPPVSTSTSQPQSIGPAPKSLQKTWSQLKSAAESMKPKKVRFFLLIVARCISFLHVEISQMPCCSVLSCMLKLVMLNDYQIFDYQTKCLFSFSFVSHLILGLLTTHDTITNIEWSCITHW